MAEENGLVVTLKGSGKDAPWIVVRGDAAEIVRHIRELFNFPEEEIAGLDPVELVINADSTFKALTVVGEVLGGRPIANVAEKTGKGWADTQAGDAWQEAERQLAGATETAEEAAPAPEAPAEEGAPENGSQEPQRPYAAVIADLEAAKSVQELTKIWEREQKGGYPGYTPGAFKNEDVIKAYQAVGRALKKGGK